MNKQDMEAKAMVELLIRQISALVFQTAAALAGNGGLSALRWEARLYHILEVNCIDGAQDALDEMAENELASKAAVLSE
jgi:hypothetical protein